METSILALLEKPNSLRIFPIFTPKIFSLFEENNSFATHCRRYHIERYSSAVVFAASYYEAPLARCQLRWVDFWKFFPLLLSLFLFNILNQCFIVRKYILVSGDTTLSDNTILQCLLKKKQMSFQDIFPECSKNRNVARKKYECTNRTRINNSRPKSAQRTEINHFFNS